MHSFTRLRVGVDGGVGGGEGSMISYHETKQKSEKLIWKVATFSLTIQNILRRLAFVCLKMSSYLLRGRF